MLRTVDASLRLDSPVTYRIVMYLLSHPHASQVEVAEQAGASRNLVNHVVAQLQASGLAAQRGRMRLELVDHLRLLEALSIQRPLSKLVLAEVRTEESNPEKVERQIRNASAHFGFKYALTAFSALSKYTEYYLNYPSVHVYCNRPPDLLGQITAGRGDVTVVVIRPDFESIITHARRINDLRVVDPIQAVIDIFGLGGGGRDGAIRLYNQEVVQGKLEKNTTGGSVIQRTA